MASDIVKKREGGVKSRVVEVIESLIREELKDDKVTQEIAINIFRLAYERKRKEVETYIDKLIAEIEGGEK